MGKEESVELCILCVQRHYIWLFTHYTRIRARDHEVWIHRSLHTLWIQFDILLLSDYIFLLIKNEGSALIMIMSTLSKQEIISLNLKTVAVLFFWPLVNNPTVCVWSENKPPWPFPVGNSKEHQASHSPTTWRPRSRYWWIERWIILSF